MGGAWRDRADGAGLRDPRVWLLGLAGIGALWLPQYMARPHLDSGELLPLFTDWRFEPLPLYLAFAPDRHVRAKLRVFLDWVSELLDRLAPVQRPAP